MKFSRDVWFALAILIGLIVVTSGAVLQQNHSSQVPYLSTSSAPDGTLALKLWLNRLGYAPLSTVPTRFDPMQNIKAILIIEPVVDFSERELSALDQWIEQGGTLLLAGDNYQTELALEHFKFALSYLESQASSATTASPLLNSPPLTLPVPATLDLALSSTRTDFVVLLDSKGGPALVALTQGKGRLLLASTPVLFSNAALKDDAVAAAILNMMALSSGKGTIWFDEWHHGLQTEAIVGPQQWLRGTAGGRSLLFAVGVIFVVLLLQGRAFGRPIPLAHEIKRRGPLEHVTAIANLNRKAGHRAEVLQQYHQRLKRALGQRYRLDPSVPDAEYVQLLARYNSAIDQKALLNLLQRLSQKKPNENDLVRLASEAAQWIKE